ncbi:MAG: GNAT family N-acetyltransferase [Proteobacteria bacterium]|nr:GNAT family N-acetyltransferase [Pseudomonadota bacterium]
MTPPFVVEPLGAGHDRRGFTCGAEPLDRYFHERVTQDIRRRIANCFVAVDGVGAVAGYYTLSAAGLPMTDLPEEEAKRLPRYPLLPACRIGRLAVATTASGHGLGAAFVVDAVTRAMRAEPAIFALLVDAKDEAAARFYAHLGFRPLASRKSGFYLPVAEVARQVVATRQASGR